MLFTRGAAAPVSPARLAIRAAAAAVASCVTHAAACAVAVRRPLVLLQLSDSECEEQGLPLGSVTPAVSLQPGGTPWWHCDAWFDAEDGSPEGCMNLRLLGWRGEVFYVRKAEGPGKAL